MTSPYSGKSQGDESTPEKGEAMAELSARQNIVVIADEAHRSQYWFGVKVNERTGEMSYGFASNLRDALPNASFIALTPSLPPLGRASPSALCCPFAALRARFIAACDGPSPALPPFHSPHLAPSVPI